MPIDVLQVQLAAAQQRFTTLQRKAEDERAGGSPKLLTRALHELESALEEARVAQEQLVENRSKVEELQAELARQADRYWRLFNEMPQPYFVTRRDSVIIEVNRAASGLVNVSQRFLVGKALSVFVGEDRARFFAQISHVAQQADPMTLHFRLRPRERAAVDVRATVQAEDEGLRWVIVPVENTSPVANV